MKILVLILFASTLVFSQGEHIYNDAFGFGASYNYSANNEASGSGVAVGISVLGRLDIALEYANSKSDIEFSDIQIESSSTLVSVAYNSKLKSRGNLKISLGYLNISSNMRYNSSFKGSGLAFGILLNYKMIDTKDFILMPGIGIVYGFLSSSSNNSGESTIADLRNLGLEVNFTFNLANELKFILTPSVSADLLAKENSIFTGIGAGLLFNFIPTDEEETNFE